MMVAGSIAVGLLVVIWTFQLALALGAPWGQAAWGGQHAGTLPVRFRVASGVAALALYPLMTGLVLVAADIVAIGWLPVNSTVMWVLAGFFLLGTVANLASRSKVERIWGPVALAIAVCCVVIASGL